MRPQSKVTTMKNNDDWMARLAALKDAMGDDNSPCTEPEGLPEPDIRTVQGRLDIVLEKKGRAGKCATIICGFTLPDNEINEIAARLKRSLGCGGSARGGEILIQGDRRKDVLRLLAEEGFKARII